MAINEETKYSRDREQKMLPVDQFSSVWKACLREEHSVAQRKNTGHGHLIKLLEIGIKRHFSLINKIRNS